MRGTMAKSALPTLESALDPASHEIVGVSRAGESCSPSTGGQRGGLRTDQGTTLRLKAELPAKRNRAALKRAEGPLMIHSFNKYFLSTYHMPGIVLMPRTQH